MHSKIAVDRCTGRLDDVGKVRVLLHCYELGGIHILFRRGASQYESQYKLYCNADIAMLSSRQEFIVRFRAK